MYVNDIFHYIDLPSKCQGLEPLTGHAIGSAAATDGTGFDQSYVASLCLGYQAAQVWKIIGQIGWVDIFNLTKGT